MTALINRLQTFLITIHLTNKTQRNIFPILTQHKNIKHQEMFPLNCLAY